MIQHEEKGKNSHSAKKIQTTKTFYLHSWSSKGSVQAFFIYFATNTDIESDSERANLNVYAIG